MYKFNIIALIIFIQTAHSGDLNSHNWLWEGKKSSSSGLRRTRQIFPNPIQQNTNNQFNQGRRLARWPQDQDNDFFVFDAVESNANVDTTTRRTGRVTPVPVPGMGTTQSPCEDRCLTTPQYNPVCGDDDMTYFSNARLGCAIMCGKRVRLKHLGKCSIKLPIG